MRWLTLKAILDRSFFARTYLWVFGIPALVKLTQKLPDQVDFSIGNQTLVLQLVLPFSWIVLYFAALLGFTSYLLFVFFCPKFLRQYSSAGQALADGVTLQYLRREQQEFFESYFRRQSIPEEERSALQRLFTQFGAADAQFFASLDAPDGKKLSASISEAEVQTENGGQNYKINGRLILRDQFIKHAFNDLVALQNITYRKLRRLIAIMLIVAGLCAAYVVIEGLIYVIQYTKN